MAREYYEKLRDLVEKLDLENQLERRIHVKHLFSGVCLYVDDTICASWSPCGLASKLAEDDVQRYIDSGKAIPLKYFPKGHVKKGYACFVLPEQRNAERWRKYIGSAIGQLDI